MIINRKIKTTEFSDLKEKIEEAINEKFKNGQLQFNEPVTLVQDFVNQFVVSNLDGVVLGGNAVPMVMLVGNESGIIHYIALKMLLPDLHIFR